MANFLGNFVSLMGVPFFISKIWSPCLEYTIKKIQDTYEGGDANL
jgi:hypothetical protein